MQNFIDQANHNQAFHDQIHASFPETYYDWKVTTLFYVAIHLLKSLAAKRKINIGDSHESISKNIKPIRGYEKPSMPLSTTAYDNYKSLYQYSRTSRYDGMTDPIGFEEEMKDMHDRALICLRNFRLYIEDNLKKER